VHAPDALAVTPDGKTVYVAAGLDKVVSISTATNTALKPITVGKGPVGVAITPDGSTAYVVGLGGTTNDREGTVTPIRTASNTALRPIPVGKAWPIDITVTIAPDGKTAYVVNVKQGTVTPIRTDINKARAPLDVPNATAIAITPDSAMAYVASGDTDDHETVVPVQLATGKVLPSIRVPPDPETIAVAR
jgi:YVTN family beta-propeller protein